MNIFQEPRFSGEVKNPSRAVEKEIEKIPDDELVSMEKDEFIEYIVSEYGIERLQLGFDEATVSIEDTTNRERPSVEIPYAGNEDIVEWRPQSSRVKSYIAEVDRKKYNDYDKF